MAEMAAYQPVWAVIDLGALEHNHREVVRRVGTGVKVIASIKADAYGHGAVACARRLADAGVHVLATGDVAEAVAMRDAGIRTPILIFGSFLPRDVPHLLAYDLIPTVYNMEAAEAVSRAARAPSPVYVKVDCGLGRLGVALDDAAGFVRRIASLPNLQVAGLYTHIPFFDDASRARTEARLPGFEALAESLARDMGPLVTQALASSAVLAGLKDRCNAVCVGHILYGLSSMAPGQADMSAFRPVLREIGSHLIHVAHHPAGRDLAIGGHYGIANAMVTGVLPVGAQHGMRTAAPGQVAEVLIRGRRAKVMSVTLEHTTLDLTGIDSPRLGEEVLVLGGEGPARIGLEDVASWQGRPPLEVSMTFSKRLPAREI
jgi:alanine racemase